MWKFCLNCTPPPSTLIHYNKVSLMRASKYHPKCHLSHRHLLFDNRRVRAAPGRKWARNLASLAPNTGRPSRPMLRRGSAAITHGGLMLLMRESLPRRPAHPQGVATQHQVNLSWQIVQQAALTKACTSSHTHRFMEMHTCTYEYTHTQIHKNTHSHTKPPSFIGKSTVSHTQWQNDPYNKNEAPLCTYNAIFL